MTNAVNLSTVAATGFLRNRIINGAMVIDQRNAGASVTPIADQYLVDRFNVYLSQSSKFTAQQNAGSVTPPSGFTNYLGLTVAAAANVTVGAGDYFGTRQMIEGFNVADLGWGAAGASTVTLSFWVRCSLTGTMGGSLTNSSRSYPFTFTVSAANTWEYKTITVPGDTSGTWNKTNGIGIEVRFSLGGGSSFAGTAGAWATGNFVTATGATNIISTNNATFYVTGVQLEVGTVATPFERRLYGTELALCQRYCLAWRPQVNSGATSFPAIAIGYAAASTSANCTVQTPVALRATPTLSYTGTITFVAGAVAANVSSLPTVYEASNSSFWFQAACSSGSFTLGNGGILYCGNSTSNALIASAEL